MREVPGTASMRSSKTTSTYTAVTPSTPFYRSLSAVVDGHAVHDDHTGCARACSRRPAMDRVADLLAEAGSRDCGGVLADERGNVGSVDDNPAICRQPIHHGLRCDRAGRRAGGEKQCGN